MSEVIPEIATLCRSLVDYLNQDLLCPITGDVMEVTTIGHKNVNYCRSFGYIYINRPGNPIVRVAEEKTLNLVCEIDTTNMSIKYIAPKLEQALIHVEETADAIEEENAWAAYANAGHFAAW